MQGPSGTESVRLGRTRSQHSYRVLRSFFASELQIPHDEAILFTRNVSEKTITINREGAKRPITKSFAKWPNEVQKIIVSSDRLASLLDDEKIKFGKSLKIIEGRFAAKENAIKDKRDKLREEIRQRMKMWKASQKNDAPNVPVSEGETAFSNPRLQSGPYPQFRGKYRAQLGRS